MIHTCYVCYVSHTHLLPEVLFPVPGVHDLSSERVEYNRNATEQDAVEETFTRHEVSNRLEAKDALQR